MQQVTTVSENWEDSINFREWTSQEILLVGPVPILRYLNTLQLFKLRCLKEKTFAC
jgi:hypothetical protein